MVRERREWTEFKRRAEDVLRLPDISPAMVDRCLSLSGYCDVTDARQLADATNYLLRLAGRLWEEQGPESGQRPLIDAMNIALSAYATTGNPVAVSVLANQLTRRNLAYLSLALYDRALTIDVPPRADMRPSAIAILQNNRGNLLRDIGERDQAEIALTDSLDAIDKTSDDEQRLLSAVLNNLALVYIQKHDSVQARDTLIEALHVMDGYGADPTETAITIDNLAQAEIDLGHQAGPLWLSDEYVSAAVAAHFNEAEHYLDRAQELFAGQLPQASEDYAISLVTSADLAAERKDTAKRAEYARRAVELVEQGNLSRGTATLVTSLNARLLVDEGQPRKALALLLPVFEDASTMESNEFPPRLLTTFLRAATLSGDRVSAERAGRALAEIDDDRFQRELAGAGESEAQRIFHSYGGQAELIVGHCLSFASDGIAPTWLYDLMLNRKGVLAERQGSAWLRARAGGGRFTELLEQVRLLRAEVSRVALDGAHDGAIQSARRSYDDAMRRLARAEAQLNRELGPGQAAPRITTADVQACLDPDSLLLDLVMSQGPNGHRHYIVFLVRSVGQVEFRDLGQTLDVDERIRALQGLLATAPAAGADPDDAAEALERTVPEMFRPGDVLARHIVVAPTGLWGLVPAGLLPDAGNVPLIDRHVVDTVPSARWLLTRVDRDEDAGAPQVLGDPDFDLGFPEELPFFLSMRVPRLAYAGDEVRDIAASLGVQPAVGEDVNRERLLSLSRPRILHLATHGVFLDAMGSIAEQREGSVTFSHVVAGTVVTEDRDISEAVTTKAADSSAAGLHRQRVEWLRTIGPSGQLSRSALLLAGFNRWLAGLPTAPETGTGMISAGEFALLDLAGTELVVLSACETGVGAVNYADGTLLGLRTAALAAGAVCCVSSLWKVDDEQTSLLMSEFYRGLARGEPPSAALRNAQLDLRERGADPHFWAGWITEGASLGGETWRN